MVTQGYNRPHGDLWRRWREAGDERAREGLYAAYAFLVPKTRERVVPVVPVKIDVGDLLQVGCLYLFRAVEKFEPVRPVKFESYALSLIRGSMLEFLRTEDWAPRLVRDKGKRIAAAEMEYTLRTGQLNAKPEELAAILRMDVDAFFQLYHEANLLQVVSLEDVVGDSEHDDLDPLHVAEQVAGGDDPERDAHRRTADAALWQAVAWLPVLERVVMQGYYRDGLLLKQIAKDIGRSESRAHQLHAQATTRLAGFLRPVAGLWGEG